MSSLSNYLSAFRNTYTTSTIAIGLYGFSNTFRIDMSVNTLKLMSISMFIYSFLYGLNATLIFKNELKKMDKVEPLVYNYLYFSYAFLGLLAILIALTLLRLVRRIF
jgi:hypothetical protein